jgi:hypothetical protein
MYSHADRIRAVELYLKLGKRIRATILQQGYPSTGRLEYWLVQFAGAPFEASLPIRATASTIEPLLNCALNGVGIACLPAFTTGAGKAEFWQHRRQKYMLSGLLRCGCCGGAYSMISASMRGCSTARKKGTCDNRRNIRRDRLEERILDALRHHLMDPALFAEFCGEFTKEVNRLRGSAGAAIAAARAELKKIDRDLDTLVELILKGGPADRINAKMVRMEARQKELERDLAQSQDPPAAASEHGASLPGSTRQSCSGSRTQRRTSTS